MPMFPVYLCLLLSGASSLIYETVWTRQLAYWFSGTAVTSSLVLTAFMAGMAAGAWFAGRKLTRLASPLKAYVFVELGLAATGVMFPGMIQTVGGWYLKWLAGTSIPPAMLATLKFTSFVIVLGIPSFLMGVTLPLLVLAIGTRRGQAGSEVGRLYAANNLGAVLGTLAAGFWLIESMGVTGTSQAGAIGNV